MQVRNVRHSAVRLTLSVGASVLVVMATAVPASATSASPTDVPASDRIALILGGTTAPTLTDTTVSAFMDNIITPAHPGETITPITVTSPEEFWPFTGLLRLAGLAFGDPTFFGPGGDAWPDQPWWKLTGLFDLTFDQSVRAGVTDLDAAMAEHSNDHLVIAGYSQGALIANQEKRKLAEQYPDGVGAPDIDFALGGDPNVPNGGLFARFPDSYIPVLDMSLDGPETTDTPFDTVVLVRQYDFFADFPLYPTNVIADLNAFLGGLYVHTDPTGASLAPGLSASAIKSQHGDTTYYFFPTQDLPLFDPLRTLGVPESVIDVVEPFFRVLVEMGYDRNIPLWEPTPARPAPILDLGTVAADLFDAVVEGAVNALALFRPPVPLNVPTSGPATDATGIATAAVTTPGTESVAQTEPTPGHDASGNGQTDYISSAPTEPAAPEIAPTTITSSGPEAETDRSAPATVVEPTDETPTQDSDASPEAPGEDSPTVAVSTPTVVDVSTDALTPSTTIAATRPPIPLDDQDDTDQTKSTTLPEHRQDAPQHDADPSAAKADADGVANNARTSSADNSSDDDSAGPE